VAKCTERNKFEVETKCSGGTVGKRCKRGAHYCDPHWDVSRRSEQMTEYNALRAYFRFLIGQPATGYLPPPSFEGVFRKGAEALAWHFTLGQLLPSVDMAYTETAPHGRSEVACTWAGKLSFWERDFDMQFLIDEDEDTPFLCHWQLQCKGFGNWFCPLYKSLASWDYSRETSKPFLSFYRLFRRMAHFAIRHLVNQLQGDYQSRGNHLPLLYASYKTLKQWLADNRSVDTAQELLELYWGETVVFWNRFERLFSFLFPDQWSILQATLALASERCEGMREHGYPLSEPDIAKHFADCLAEAKLDADYINDRKEVRARRDKQSREVPGLFRFSRNVI